MLKKNCMTSFKMIKELANQQGIPTGQTNLSKGWNSDSKWSFAGGQQGHLQNWASSDSPPSPKREVPPELSWVPKGYISVERKQHRKQPISNQGTRWRGVQSLWENMEPPDGPPWTTAQSHTVKDAHQVDKK